MFASSQKARLKYVADTTADGVYVLAVAIESRSSGKVYDVEIPLRRASNHAMVREFVEAFADDYLKEKEP